MNDGELLSILQEVLDRAHRGHRYVSDTISRGVLEHWDISLVGDCEDFALWCRQELKKKGIDSDLVLCKTERGEWHLVCSVNGWILDNRYSFVMSRDILNYEWISIGFPDGQWKKIIN